MGQPGYTHTGSRPALRRASDDRQARQQAGGVSNLGIPRDPDPGRVDVVMTPRTHKKYIVGGVSAPERSIAYMMMMNLS
jgi:hypothetical protein